MKITIDYDPTKNSLSVLVDRGTRNKSSISDYPPPPPFIDQFMSLTGWLNEVYALCLKRFEDPNIQAIQLEYDPTRNEQKGVEFVTGTLAPPRPPSFVK